MTYEAEISSAYTDILEAGELDTIKRYVNTPQDEDKPWDDDPATAVASASTPAAVLWLGSAANGPAKKAKQGTLIITRNRKVLIAGQGVTFTLAPNDKIVRTTGEVWNIVGVTPVEFNGEIIMYKGVVSR